MRNLYHVAQQCMEKLDAIGVKYTAPVKWNTNHRALRYGRCSRHLNGTFTIEVSIRLLNENVPIEILEDTIIHELIHTCEGCFNHGKQFHKIASIINDCYSCYNLDTKSSSEENKILQEIVPVQYKYFLFCENGCWEEGYMRKTKSIKYPHIYKCSKCGGSCKSRTA